MGVRRGMVTRKCVHFLECSVRVYGWHAKLSRMLTIKQNQTIVSINSAKVTAIFQSTACKCDCILQGRNLKKRKSYLYFVREIKVLCFQSTREMFLEVMKTT